MDAESVRLHVPVVPPHRLEDPPESGMAEAYPDSRGVGADACCPAESPAGRLWRENGKVMYQPADGGEVVAVRLAWARPLSDRGPDGPVSVMLAGKKKEVAFIPRLADFTCESLRVAEEELAAGMVLPRITKVNRVRPRFGNYYWDVETTMGHRLFLLTSPEANSFEARHGAVVVKDVSGNCYEIDPASALDPASASEVDRVL